MSARAREHLLLAARERAGGLVPALLEKGWIESAVEEKVEAHPEQEHVAGGGLTGIAASRRLKEREPFAR